MFGINLVTNALKTLAANLSALGATVAEINLAVRERLGMDADENALPAPESNGRGRKHVAAKE